MSLTLDLPTPEATARLGASLADGLVAGDMICLIGGLGAGKTTLARGLIGALMGAPVEVPSPTFTLVQLYEAPALRVWHFDLYRLETAEEVVELGWEEAADGLALVEWPEQAGRFLPRQRLDVRLTANGEGRIARLEPHGERWQEHLNGLRRPDA